MECSWGVERVLGGFYAGDDEDSWVEAYDAVVPCGAPVTEDARGWACDAGHSHVFGEVRFAEGWDYAEDEGDARNLTRAGVEPRDLVTGGPYVDRS